MEPGGGEEKVGMEMTKPKRSSQPWTDEEDMDLTVAFLSFLDERTEHHERTEYAIISRLERLMSSRIYGFIKARLEEEMPKYHDGRIVPMYLVVMARAVMLAEDEKKEEGETTT